MKIYKGFITHTVGNEQIMVAAGAASKRFHGMVQSNPTAAFIVNCLKKPATEEEIVDAVLAHYSGVDRRTAAKDIDEILTKLRSINALDE